MSPRPFFLFHPLARGRPWTPRTTCLRSLGGAFPSITGFTSLWHDAAKSAVFLGARGEIILDAINRAHQLTSIQCISSPQSSSASRPMRHPFLPNSMPARGIAASNPLTHPSVRPDNSQQDAHRDGIPEWGRHHGTTAPGTGQGDVPRWLLATGRQPTADGRRRCQSTNPMAPFSTTARLACVSAQPCCPSPTAPRS